MGKQLFCGAKLYKKKCLERESRYLDFRGRINVVVFFTLFIKVNACQSQRIKKKNKNQKIRAGVQFYFTWTKIAYQ